MGEVADSSPVIYARGRSSDNGPAWGAHTLFVSRQRPAEEVRRYLGHAQHVCFTTAVSDAKASPDMLDEAGLSVTVRTLLNAGLWVSVEYPAERHQRAARRLAEVWSHERFIAQPSFNLPSAAPAANLMLKVRHGGGVRRGFWSVALRDLDRTRAWAPFRNTSRREIVAREDDLA